MGGGWGARVWIGGEVLNRGVLDRGDGGVGSRVAIRFLFLFL